MTIVRFSERFYPAAFDAKPGSYEGNQNNPYGDCEVEMDWNAYPSMHISARDDQSAMNAAARGLNMNGMSLLDLKDLIREFEGKGTQAAKDIVAAAKQMMAAKKRMGARE
jgi:hypothetical protein